MKELEKEIMDQISHQVLSGIFGMGKNDFIIF